MANMQTGTVRKWTDKGYGFITPDGSDEDVFVHNTAFGGGSLAEGEKVNFSVARDSGGKTRAENVSGPAVLAPPAGAAVMQKGGAALQKDMQLIGKVVTGVVREWYDDKGFGFIEPKDVGGSIFCHNTAFGGGVLAIGTPVTLTVVADPRSGKPRAENVQALQGGTVQQAANAAAGMMAPGMMMPGMGLPGMPGMPGMSGQAANDPLLSLQMQQMVMMQMQMMMQSMAGQPGAGLPFQPGMTPLPGVMPGAGAQ
eukprot:Hpha_TRINITY_DN16304_c4_g10::TRINITY_DN16304_c4_g10_i1::g.59250::m.59250